MVCNVQVKSSLSFIGTLPRLVLVDMRGTHVEETTYWTESKCVTMQHAATLMKTLRRKHSHAHVLMDLL